MKGQKKKALWAAKRAANAEKREAERKANTAKPFRKKREFVELKPRDSKYVITDEMKRAAEAPSAAMPAPTGVVRVDGKKAKRNMGEDEYARREAEAQKEIKRKKTKVAPLYNKGGYQYVGDDAPPEIIKNLGRKV